MNFKDSMKESVKYACTPQTPPGKEPIVLNIRRPKSGFIKRLNRMTLKPSSILGLFRSELKEASGLENLSILQQPQGTNFPVTDEEWKIISSLMKQQID